MTHTIKPKSNGASPDWKGCRSVTAGGSINGFWLGGAEGVRLAGAAAMGGQEKKRASACMAAEMSDSKVGHQMLH